MIGRRTSIQWPADATDCARWVRRVYDECVCCLLYPFFCRLLCQRLCHRICHHLCHLHIGTTMSNHLPAPLPVAPARQIRHAIAPCTLGLILVAATPGGVCAILLGDDPHVLESDLQHRFPQARLTVAGPEFDAVLTRSVALVDAPHIDFDVQLDIGGTAFQQCIWQALRQIPAGRTVSYAELAAIAGVPNGARAVAGACAANALAVAIPCHRVVRSDGTLSGYRWGVVRKRALLECEAQQMA